MCVQDPQDSLIVLSGCGTSGRIAFLVAVKKSTTVTERKPVFQGVDLKIKQAEKARNDLPAKLD